MSKKLDDLIIEKLGIENIINVLSYNLSGSELNTVLLNVFNRRIELETPSSLLNKYSENKFVKPANIDLLAFKEKELECYKVLVSEGFDPVELSPVAQLGTNSVVATVNQKKVLSALRSTEVMADPTNAIALYYAHQKKNKLFTDQTYNFSNIARVVRTQSFNNPNFSQHFAILCLVSCGRDIGNYSFEKAELYKQVSLTQQICLSAFGLQKINVDITPCKGFTKIDPLIISIVSYVQNKLPNLNINIVEPDEANKYYYGFRIKYTTEIKGTVYDIGDGGLLDWTQQLLNNKKERFMTTGIGFQLLYQLTK